jgi:micrococcal nuclease
MRRGAAIVLLLGLLATQAQAVPSRARSATVTHVSDGDTAYMDPLRFGTTAASWDGRKARFIGVDTPEVPPAGNDCFGERASAFTKRKLEGKDVQITYGEDPIDPYDRALVYVWLNGHLFNASLVKKGFARVLIIEPNDRYETRLRRLENEARAAGRGLWGAC